MSVIITGTNIPKSCIECNSINCSLPYPKNSYKDTVKKAYMNKRHEDCPLKSIGGLIEKIEHLGTHKAKFITSESEVCVDVKEVLAIIKEYCEVKE